MFSSSLALIILAAAPEEITLERALESALINNAELKVSRAEVEVARAQVPLAHDWEMPKLRVQFNDVQNTPTGQFVWYAGISWKPPNPWEWKHGDLAAQASLQEARCDLAAKSWRVVQELRLAWLDASGAAAHEKLARDTVAVRHQMVELLQKRLAQGGGTQVELNVAQLGETDARQEQLRWQTAGLKAAQSVAWLVGTPVTPVAGPIPEVTLPARETLESRLAHHPVLEGIRFKVSAARSKEQTIAATRLPWPELQTRFRQKTGTTADNDFQVGLTVPLGVTPAPKLEVARAVIARNEAQLAAEEAQRRSELEVLRVRAEGLQERLISFEKEFRQALASHRELQKRVLAEGTLDPALLLTADRQAIELEHKRLEVQLDLARTIVELELTAGPPE